MQQIQGLLRLKRLISAQSLKSATIYTNNAFLLLADGIANVPYQACPRQGAAVVNTCSKPCLVSQCNRLGVTTVEKVNLGPDTRKQQPVYTCCSFISIEAVQNRYLHSIRALLKNYSFSSILPAWRYRNKENGQCIRNFLTNIRKHMVVIWLYAIIKRSL